MIHDLSNLNFWRRHFFTLLMIYMFYFDASFLLKAYESSCFSGSYVTGQNINDTYFSKLHDLRNDSAQKTKRESTLGAGSNHGCENLSNDQRDRGPAV